MKTLDIKELQNRLDAISEEQVNREDTYDYTTPDGNQITDVTDYDDYDGYSVELKTPLGPVTAEWNSASGRGFFGGIRASNRTLESMIGKIYGEMHDFESMDKDDWPVAVGKAVDKVMAMGKDNPSFMRGESVKQGDAEEQPVAEEDSVEEAIEDGKTYAWINVVTGDHGYGTKEESSNWTHYIPMSDFSYFSGDEDYKGLDDETAQEEGWIAVKESVEEGDAELAELKDIMGRSGVMGFKN